jgi:hypothetical protein
VTSTPRDEATCLWAAGLRKKRYTYALIAQMLVSTDSDVPRRMDHCSLEGARKVVAEGIRIENAMIREEMENDPYADGTREFILQRIRARVAQVDELDAITEEAWELVRQHPDKTIIDISPTLKWVAEVRAKLLGTDAETQTSPDLPPGPDRDMERRIMALGDPGV